MKIKLEFLMMLCAFSVISLQAQDRVSPIEKLQLNGELNDRLNLSHQNRILAQDIDRLVNVFKEENRTEKSQWQSEFWGKWFTSAVLAYKLNPRPELFEKIKYAAESLIKTQTADGYIGNYDKDHRLMQWDVWGRKYCLLGLLDYYELTKDPKSLAAAAKLADNLIDDLNNSDGIIVTKGNYRGMAASSVLEPMVRLYSLSKKKKYLNFAELIVNQWSLPDGPQLIEKSQVDVSSRFEKPASWYSWEQGQKAYEMMSCYEGLLELYRITGNPSYKEAVVNVWQNISATEINIAGSGASTEMWFGGKSVQTKPIHHYQEVCVTVTWIKLSLQLYRLTGETKYFEAAEISYYNALLGSLDPTGAYWAKYTPLSGQRLPGSEQCGMGLNCCEASGPRGLYLLPFYAVTKANDEVYVNLFQAGTYEIGDHSAIEIISEYPKFGKVQVRTALEKPKSFTLKIRIPSWSTTRSCTVNGETFTAENAEEYISVSREWKGQEVIDFEVDMKGRVIQEGEGDNKHFAIMRGPIVLARDAAFGENYPLGIILNPVTSNNKDIEIDVSNVSGKNVYKVKFNPESYTEFNAGPVEILMIDYASAGYLKDKSFFQTWFPQLINRK